MVIPGLALVCDDCRHCLSSRLSIRMCLRLQFFFLVIVSVQGLLYVFLPTIICFSQPISMRKKSMGFFDGIEKRGMGWQEFHNMLRVLWSYKVRVLVAWRIVHDQIAHVIAVESFADGLKEVTKHCGCGSSKMKGIHPCRQAKSRVWKTDFDLSDQQLIGKLSDQASLFLRSL